MIVSDFTKYDLDHFREYCNFVNEEKDVFELRSQGVSLECIAERLSMSVRGTKETSRKVNDKIKAVQNYRLTKEIIMKLSELLEALSCNRKLIISLMDENNKNMTTFMAVDYKGVVTDYGDEEVAKAKITSPSTMAIYFDDNDIGSEADEGEAEDSE